MTQVSKKPLRKEIEKRMYEVFLGSVAMVQTQPQVEKLLSDWLSSSEKIIFVFILDALMQ